MKKLIFLLMLPVILFAQPEFIGELQIELINRGSSWNVTIALTAVSERWDENYDLTDDYDYVSENVINDEYTAYFDHVSDISGDLPVFAIGLYKITAIESGTERAYFYMDWRTSDWSSSLDIYFKYDVGNRNFRNETNTETVNKSYQTVWGLTPNLLITSGLEDYWDNSLALIPSVNNNPYLIWGSHPDDNVYLDITGYNIYRAINSGSYSKIAEINENTYSYIDTYFMLGGSAEAHYKVTANYQDVMESLQETSPTNIASASVGLYKEFSGSETKYGFELFQNYPNPFNPTTIISWTSPKDDFVTLKVYDVLGREVVTLVNEYKNAGEHSIGFNTNELSSGVYIYRIQIGEFNHARSLMIQK